MVWGLNPKLYEPGQILNCLSESQIPQLLNGNDNGNLIGLLHGAWNIVNAQ